MRRRLVSFVYPEGGGGGGGAAACLRAEEAKLRRLWGVIDKQDAQMYGLKNSMRLSALALCKGVDIVVGCGVLRKTFSFGD